MLTFANRYTYLALLCVGFILGFYGCLVLSGRVRTVHTPAITRIPSATIQKQATTAQLHFQATIDSLGTATRHLQTDLQTTQTALHKVKQTNRALQRQVYDLLDRSPAIMADTVARISHCDSLQTSVKDLMVSDSVKDSLYETVTNNLEAQVANQDSTLGLQKEQYQALQTSFMTSLQQQQDLQSKNTALRKQINRQKRAGVRQTIGLVLATVFATHYLSHP